MGPHHSTAQTIAGSDNGSCECLLSKLTRAKRQAKRGSASLMCSTHRTKRLVSDNSGVTPPIMSLEGGVTEASPRSSGSFHFEEVMDL